MREVLLVLVVVVMVVNGVMLTASAQKGKGKVINELTAAELSHSGIADVIKALGNEMRNTTSFCTLEGNADWNKAFNYSNFNFVSACIARTQGDIAKRMCSAAEIKYYMNNFFNMPNGANLNPRRNCNLTTWVSGCEPGWACSVNSDNVDLSNSEEIPARTSNCQSCCEGFFCPQGLTCMMPCPLGAYCPQATINEAYGSCDPYSYQLPPGRNHTCGGANAWADLATSWQVFCPAGSYCPTPSEKKPCASGHYCRRGSTTQTRCSWLISCKADTVQQNIHTYGILIIVGLVALLLLIYNFSDQILAIRERRRAKYRERAAVSVQQRERVRARWKSATDAAKKHATQLHASLSKRFSPRSDPQNLRILHEINVHPDESLMSSCESNDLSVAQPSSAVSEGGNGVSLSPEIVEASVHRPQNQGQLTLEIDGANGKKKGIKPKGIKSESQIFNYAYAQIEKEKSQERQFENITFTGLISMAVGDETKKRPLMEVAFKELTLTLKGKKRRLLQGLTGRIMPGRITAVMGPSGAGKTTFMSALAGKPTGCRKTGSVLINGKPDSIHSYQKIIGFVPQDDIVHGNLTVEENLWFSARCRLSAGLPREEKVLIVERVIMNLGLQEVRDCLVGTVEKRGISGGQRKRVNVGLEMVMEPSLLFLDEPTSGLDSSSSQLLLRALKHEALAGVNVCMVVHQPSYSLFKMFDDLTLLAKGGFMVYHGSVKEVEGYFGELGIFVPERINPPDHYIDILEGLVELSASTSVSYKELPMRWMLHNGYPVPEDMRVGVAGHTPEQIERSSSGTPSFVGEVWQDIKYKVALQRDLIHHNFLYRKDLSNRRTPGVILQYKYFLGRITKQRLREAKLQATDYLILLIAGACLGAITKISESNLGASGYSFTIIAISLLCQIAALRSFTNDKLQYLRESASGISSLAHYVAKDTIDHFNVVIKPVVFLSMFYFFLNPRSSFLDNYIVLLCLVYCVTGMGHAFAIFFQPGAAQLFSVLLPVCLTLISTQALTDSSLKVVSDLCYPKWALEALVIANAKRYYGVWLINRCGALAKMGYNLHAWKNSLLILILFGVVSRAIAFIGLLIIRKK